MVSLTSSGEGLLIKKLDPFCKERLSLAGLAVNGYVQRAML